MKFNLKEKVKSPNIWAFSTYFAEGFPYTIIRSVSSLFFRDMKVSLSNIGLTSLFGLPWILKFLWGPQVDTFSTKKKWMIAVQIILTIMMFSVAFLTPLENSIPSIAVILFLGSFAAATNDIAIDGYYMEALNKKDQAKYVGYRVMAYRISMMTGTGIIVTVGTVFNWFTAFLLAAIIFSIVVLFHIYFLPEVEEEKKSFLKFFKTILKPNTFIFITLITVFIIFIRKFIYSQFLINLKNTYPFLKKIYFSHVVTIFLLIALIIIALLSKTIKRKLESNGDSYYSNAFLSFMDRKNMGIVLTFIILLRTGEWMLSNMVSPLFVDLGIKVHYGWLSTFIGLPSAIIGAMLGGFLISKYSLKKMMWPFILAQNLTNIVYMLLAFYLQHFISINTGVENPTFIGTFNLSLVAFVQGFDQFAGGLGNAVLMTYLMRICIEKYKAAHYAIGSGLMNISAMFAGIASGFIAESYGYPILFGVSFLASIPAMLLIPFLSLDD